MKVKTKRVVIVFLLWIFGLSAMDVAYDLLDRNFWFRMLAGYSFAACGIMWFRWFLFPTKEASQ